MIEKFLERKYIFQTDYFRSELEKRNVDASRALSFWELLDEGKKAFEDQPDQILDLKAAIKEDDVVNISYTSGTTGNPKGIMLSHLNYYSNTYDGISMFRLQEKFRTLVILPVDHSFAHTVGIYISLLKDLVYRCGQC